MSKLAVPRILFAAPKSGSGKTLLTCGFLEAVKQRGLCPAAFKCGPDYIDPMFHKYVLGVSGANLDSFFLDEKAVRRELLKTGALADLAVLEGVMGYYDGLGGTSVLASTYDIARITDTPAVLILDCKGACVSLAAVAAGFLHYRKDSGIAGVILNKVSMAMYERMVPLFEEMGLSVFGYLPEQPEFFLESRHLGLLMPEESETLKEKILAVAEQMERTVDIDGLLKLSKGAPFLDIEKSFPSPFHLTAPLRIGVAKDEAFSFYYQENLRLLEEMGAELVEFSPIHDMELPGMLDGIILGGGYPENFAKELSKNKTMLEAVKKACMEHMPVLAECGGFLYLHESLEGEDGCEYAMAGVVKARAYRTNRLNRFGYITLTGPFGMQIRGHEFHYWESSDPGSAFQAHKPAGGRTWRCMHRQNELLCGFPHLYYPSNPLFVKEWLLLCETYGRKK